MSQVMITGSGGLRLDKFGSYIDEFGDIVSLIDCPECGKPGAQQQNYEALDGGTINQHERIDCNACGCVKNTRDY